MGQNAHVSTIRKQTIGIDVSSKTLQVRLGQKTDSEQLLYSPPDCFANTGRGFDRFWEWVQRQTDGSAPLWFVMEATGVYYEGIAHYLHQAGANVCVLVASRAKHYAKSLPIKSKTDAIDARILAQYGLERRPRSWKPASPRLRQIKALLRERQALCEQHTRLSNRLHAARRAWQHPQSTIERLIERIGQLEDYLDQIDEELQALWKPEQVLAEPIERIAGINGVGEQTILQVVAETNGFALIDSRQQLASYSGLDVVLDESGDHKGSNKISKHGNAHIRRALYMPALSAIQHNPALKAFYERLVAKNPKRKLIALTAVMRKLLLLIYSLWKSGQHYDPDFHYRQITEVA